MTLKVDPDALFYRSTAGASEANPLKLYRAGATAEPTFDVRRAVSIIADLYSSMNR